MSKLPWSNWFWRDWDSDPGLRLVSFAAQGLWMRMLCIAAASPMRGYVMVTDHGCSVEDIARITGGLVDEVSQLLLELEKGGVFSVTAEKVIYCRRMVRENEQLRQFREAGKKGGRPRKLLKSAAEKGNPTLSKKHNPNENLARVRDGSGSGDIDSESLKTLSEKEQTAAREALFEVFWRAYPRRADKGHARTAYERAIKKATPEVILAAAAAFAMTRIGENPKFTALASTWLNGERWTDEAPPHLRVVQPFGSPGFA